MTSADAKKEFRVVVLGGTFDPPHAGHVHVAKRLLRVFSLVVVAPATQNPFKERSATSLEDRVAMLRLLLTAYQLPVSDDPRGTGIYLSNFAYERTYQFVEHWRSAHGEDLCWAIGSDLHEETQRWARIDELNLQFYEIPEYGDGSLRSSEVREGRTPPDPAIVHYVQQRRLYSL